MTTAQTKMTKDEYYEQLSRVQNCPKHAYQDIMTITGFMQTIEELAKHLRINSKGTEEEVRTGELLLKYNL